MGILDVLKAILSYYHDVNIQTELGFTPLILAAKEGHSECIKLLLNCGAKVGICDKINNMTAIHYSAKNGHFMSLMLLLEQCGIENKEAVVNMFDR